MIIMMNSSYGRNFQTNDSYLEKNDYYDEFEPITPIGREKDRYPRRDYEYYPDDFSQGENNRKKYEYEPYNDNFYDVEDKQFEPRYKEPLNQYDDYGRDSVAYEPNSIRYEESYDDYGRDSAAYESNSIRYDEPSNQYSDKSYYNEVRDEYSYRDDEYYQNNGREVHYNDDANNNVQDKSVDVDDSSEKVIRRHFDKFKK